MSDPRLLRLVKPKQCSNNLNPTFARNFFVNYHFENSERLRFVIYRIDGNSEKILMTLAQLECSLGEVLSQGGSTQLPFEPIKGSTASVLSVQIRSSHIAAQAVRLQFCGHHISSPLDHCPINAYFIMLLSPEGAKRQLLYKSESIADKNPTWKSFVIPLSHFTCPSTSTCSIEVDVYNYVANAEDKLIGKFSTSLDHLLRGTGPINSYKLLTSDRRKKDHTSMELLNVIQIACNSFLDFIRSGTQIHFSVAVDFTASNGNPLNPDSLHYIHPHKFNPYMTALCSVSSVIEKYNRHGRIAALGFGAQTPPDFKVSHLFFMNGDARDPHVSGVDGLMNAYRSSLLAVRPYAPTDFSEVIYHVYKFGAAANRQTSSEHYFVLLIVTDGCVTEPKKTLDAIVECSYLPISIVIVGVGQRDYSPMEILMSPTLKSSSSGRTLQREIVTFVPYEPTMPDSELVAKLLMNVPKQFVTWALLNGKYPARIDG
uniref:Copine-8 n=1 Tax=Ascaris suum TaxID=6253 RepID=F1L3T1_ASCSU